MGGLINSNPHKTTEAAQNQRVVDAFFQRSPHYWRDVYHDDSLDAIIYQERQLAVLTMADQLRLPDGSRVLEVGCGAGLTAVALAKRGFAVNATDTVQAMLDLTRRAAVDAGVHPLVKITLNSVLEISFPSERFNLAIAMGVIPWLERPEKAIFEMARVLKPGGYLILTTDNHWCLHQMLDPLCFPGLRRTRWKIGDALQKFNLRSPSRPRLYCRSIKQVDELLRQAGLDKVQSLTLGFGPFTFFKRKLIPDGTGIKLHRRLQALANRQFPGIRSTGTEYVVTARKSQTV